MRGRPDCPRAEMLAAPAGEVDGHGGSVAREAGGSYPQGPGAVAQRTSRGNPGEIHRRRDSPRGGERMKLFFRRLYGWPVLALILALMLLAKGINAPPGWLRRIDRGKRVKMGTLRET